MIERTFLPGGGAHLEDGELVRLLDGELGPGERSVAEGHVTACGQCRTAQERIAARTTRVSSALSLIDDVRANADSEAIRSTEFRRAPRAGWLRAAAIAVLVVTIGALASSTVRGWIAEGWKVVLVVSDPAKPAADPASGPAGPETVRARFVPRSGALLVRLENRTAGGVLTVKISEDGSRSVVLRSRSEEGILVLPSGLVIQNVPGSRADYGLLVPPDLTSVTAIAGTDTLAVLHPRSERRVSWEIPLVD